VHPEHALCQAELLPGFPDGALRTTMTAVSRSRVRYWFIANASLSARPTFEATCLRVAGSGPVAGWAGDGHLPPSVSSLPRRARRWRERSLGRTGIEPLTRNQWWAFATTRARRRELPPTHRTRQHRRLAPAGCLPCLPLRTLRRCASCGPTIALLVVKESGVRGGVEPPRAPIRGQPFAVRTRH
jgi:hypothetical protein